MFTLAYFIPVSAFIYVKPEIKSYSTITPIYTVSSVNDIPSSASPNDVFTVIDDTNTPEYYQVTDGYEYIKLSISSDMIPLTTANYYEKLHEQTNSKMIIAKTYNVYKQVKD